MYTEALILSTLFWILRELLTSEQACSYTCEDFLQHTMFVQLSKESKTKGKNCSK